MSQKIQIKSLAISISLQCQRKGVKALSTETQTPKEFQEEIGGARQRYYTSNVISREESWTLSMHTSLVTGSHGILSTCEILATDGIPTPHFKRHVKTTQEHDQTDEDNSRDIRIVTWRRKIFATKNESRIHQERRRSRRGERSSGGNKTESILTGQARRKCKNSGEFEED